MSYTFPSDPSLIDRLNESSVREPSSILEDFEEQDEFDFDTFIELLGD